jgi:hypothetical protein
VALYRAWTGQRFDTAHLGGLFRDTPAHAQKAIWTRVQALAAPSVYDAYNAATWVATHHMRSYRTAFKLLAQVNRSFQERFPA